MTGEPRGSMADRRAMKPRLYRLGRAVLAGYAGVLLLVAGCQTQILYQPRRASEAALIAAARARGLEPWRDAQGRLIGWVRPNPRGDRGAGNSFPRSTAAAGSSTRSRSDRLRARLDGPRCGTRLVK